MSRLFNEGSDSDNEDLKIDNDYARNYNNWRKKEEINKLKTKYGDDLDDSTSESESEDDEEGVELTEKVEREFFKTLACLKNKDPKIYDENVKFFENVNETKKPESENKKKAVFLKDYERELLLKKGGIVSDEETEDNPVQSPTYVEEQKQAKEGLKKALGEVEESDEEAEWGGMFKKRQKTKEETNKEDTEYKMWLAGEKDKLKDETIETELKPLKEYWMNPKLDEGEKFLRDYILNKRFLDKENDNYVPSYEEIVHDSDDDLTKDEETIEKQEEFEHKYNFRFEEPDQEFIKRYPRTIEGSLRKVDDKRKLKRQEVRERKKKEKEEKMRDLKKLRELKRKEIEEKLEKLKEITGNASLGFADEDLEDDFDPEKHDKRMQELFNNDFYEIPEQDQKPMFPDLDDDLEIENYDNFEAENNVDYDTSPHCEDENFNMDCDYDPTEIVEKPKRRKRKSKFAQAVSKPKPKYDPNDKTYEQYFEEYYKLDCEDFIGDLPCRFKYREVVPNDFGLTVEEILLAKERELNKWCSLKKAVQIRPESQEKYDRIAYQKKAQNIALKKKILPSLYGEENETESVENAGSSQQKGGERRKVENEDKEIKKEEAQGSSGESSRKRKGDESLIKMDTNGKIKVENGLTNENKEVKQESTQAKKRKLDKNLVKTEASEECAKKENNLMKEEKTDEEIIKKTVKKSKKKKQKNSVKQNSDNLNKNINKKKKFNNKSKEKSALSNLTDERLKAYGMKPKRFRNKLIYKKEKINRK